jgi:hypothetical protein
MRRTTITLPDEVLELLGSEARRRQTSVSDVARQLIVEGLTGTTENPREIPWAGLFSDPDMVSGERLDDFLSERHCKRFRLLP